MAKDQQQDHDQEDKTEDPSPYRLEKSQEEGDVAFSRDLNSVVIMAGMLGTLYLSSTWISDQLHHFIDEVWRKTPQEIINVEATMVLAKLSLWFFFKSLWPLLLVAIVLSIIIPFFQVGAIFAPNQLTVNPERINPLQGFKKIFSFKSVLELIKSLLKMSLMLLVLYGFSSQIISDMRGFFDLSLEALLDVAVWNYMKVAIALLCTFFILALMDLSYEKFSFFQKMKMTKKELKEELKEREGNPEIRSKIKSLQREMARKKMFKELPKADVLITNPTHYAVAIKYDKNAMQAPIVIAKGADFLALKLRDLAKVHQVVIVENVTLARTLYSDVKLGDAIPRNLYQAVAQLLGFVYKMKRSKAALS